MANELLDTIFAGIVRGADKDRYLTLYEQVDDAFFSNEYLDLWKIVCRVYDVSKHIVDRNALDKILPASGLEVERIVKIEDLWHRLEDRPPVSDADFYTSISLLQEDYRTTLMGEALTESLDVLRVGIKDERTGIVKHGPDDALSTFREKVADVEVIGAEQLPEFNIREQKEDLLAELVSEDNMLRVSTGIVPLDEMTMGGHGKGELWLPLAGTGVGKSMICTNIAWYRLTQGDNVVYFTTETLFQQIRHRIIMRHTHLFVEGGLSSMKVKMHNANEPTLTQTEYDAYLAAIEDFTSNPTYGQLIVCQIPDGTKMSSVSAKLERWRERLGTVDYCIIDSLDMLSAEVRRNEQRHELDSVVNAAKALCISFDKGKGLRVLAPWQANRDGEARAIESGQYDIKALGDTHMAAKRADLILALLQLNDTPHKLKGQTLKFRDSSKEDFELNVFYDNAYIGSTESMHQSHGAGGLESML